MNRAEKRKQRKLLAKSAKRKKPLQSLDPAVGGQNNVNQLNLELAIEHHLAGRFVQAENIYQQILESDPNHPDALHLLGVIAQHKGRNDVAVELIQKALTFEPNYADAHYNLGNAFKDLGKFSEAATSYRAAIAIKPNFPDAHNNLGLVLQELGQLDEAVTSYQTALSFKPDLAMTHRNLGLALQELGRLSDAVASFRKAITFQPDYAEAYRNLSTNKKFSEYDDDIKAMEDVYALPGLSAEQKAHLAFGLGKSFEDLKQYEKSSQFYLTANAVKRSTYEFSINTVEKYVGLIKSIFTRELFRSHKSSGLSDETPVFILGMPRSGTTLVEQILSSHPKVFGAGELNALEEVIAPRFGKVDDIQFLDNLVKADTSQFIRAGEDYINLIRNSSKTADLITNKSPHNFLMIGMIKLILPNAKIIHCCRDSRDTCLSIFKNYFAGDGHCYAYDQVELGQYYNLYRDLMSHWHNVLPDFIHDMDYEKLVSEQEEKTRTLLDHMGLEWDDACLEFYKSERIVKTASAAQVRKPIHKGSVHSWKQYESSLKPLLEILKNY